MNRDSVSWRGYMPAITTPFNKAGELDLTALATLVDWLVAEGMHGLVLLGTTGEWFSLTAQEKRDVYRTVGRQVAGRIPVIAGCNSFAPVDAIQSAAAAAEHGLDGILLAPPAYISLSPREIVAFYAAVNRECRLPICVYNWPPGTNTDLSCETLQQLAALENVVALKNSTSNLSAFCDVFFALKEQIRIFGFTSTQIGVSLVRHHGLDGSMGAAGILGREHPQFFEAMWKGDYDCANRLAARDLQLMNALYKRDLTAVYGSAQAVCKEALNQLGLPGGYPRPPILPLLREEQQCVRSALVALGKL